MQTKAELMSKIESLQKEMSELKAPEKAFDETIDLIRKIMRAKQGLPPEDDIFSGLIHIDDVRERTRLDEYNVYSHAYMRLLSDVGGDEWEIMKKMADMEDPYFISLDGEQRKEAILMKRANTAMDTQNLNINLPTTNPAAIQEEKEAQGPPAKKSWLPWKRH